MSGALTKLENEWDKNVPPILVIYLDRRGFLTPLEVFSGEAAVSYRLQREL